MIASKLAAWKVIEQNRENEMAWFEDAYTRMLDLTGQDLQSRGLDRIELVWTCMQRGPRSFPGEAFAIKQTKNKRIIRAIIKDWDEDTTRLMQDRKKSKTEIERLQALQFTCELVLNELREAAEQEWYICRDRHENPLSLAVITRAKDAVDLTILATNPCAFQQGAASALLGHVEILAEKRPVSLTALLGAVPFYAARGYFLNIQAWLNQEGSEMIKPAPGQPLVLVDGRSQPPQ